MCSRQFSKIYLAAAGWDFPVDWMIFSICNVSMELGLAELNHITKASSLPSLVSEPYILKTLSKGLFLVQVRILDVEKIEKNVSIGWTVTDFFQRQNVPAAWFPYWTDSHEFLDPHFRRLRSTGVKHGPIIAEYPWQCRWDSFYLLQRNGNWGREQAENLNKLGNFVVHGVDWEEG